MIQFIRSLFQRNGSAANRTVVGNNKVSIDLKDVPYIQSSNTRLNLLHHLYNRYKGTAHALKIKAVYEKTKGLHTYLVAKKRVHELELFHLQHTDHFISTFTVILDVYQKHSADTAITSPTDSKAALSAEKIKSDSGSGKEITDSVRNRSIMQTPESGTEKPQFVIPAISVNTYAQLAYERIDASGNLITNEISYTSTEQEKEAFVATISPRLGIYKLDIAYVGNAQVYLPTSTGSASAQIMPVLNWKGCLYVLNLNDYRLFPVRINRKSL